MERNYAIDLIKFFAITAVVVIHTFPSNDLLGYFLLDNFSRFAVPFFFAASGYLFGIKVIHHPKSAAYFKKYEIKILKIYLCWLAFYTIYDMIRFFRSNGNIGQELTKYFAEWTALGLLYYGQGTSGYQLWFVIALAWSIAVLYLFFRLQQITLLLILNLCFYIAGLFGQSYSVFFELPVTTTRDALFIGLFYTTAGFCFAYSPFFQTLGKWDQKIYVYFFWFFSALQALEGYWLEKGLSAQHGEYFLSTIFLTICLFLYALRNHQFGRGSLMTKIGSQSLGIYAVHVFFIDMVDRLFTAFGLEPASHHLLWNLIDALLVFTLSYLTYHFLQVLKSRLSFKDRFIAKP